MELRIEQLPFGQRKKKCSDPAELGFGRYFTDHMLVSDWREGEGWHDARIVPYGPFQLEPAAAVFHYGQEIFEGLKAYRQPDGSIALFRPEMNLARFNRSAARLSMPEVEAELFLDGLLELLRLEADWVPTAPGASLYIRPALIATEPALGVKASREYRFFVILSPVGTYYPTGFQPIRLLLEERLARAAPGGTGAAKCGGNYAASLLAARGAKERGFDQVLWLDALEHRYVEEVGAMNIFFVIDGELVTPPLSETILGGITRDSLLQLAPRLGVAVAERPVVVAELLEGCKNGRVSEVFAAGTAAVIAPVGALGHRDDLYPIGKGEVGRLTRLLYDNLIDIQYGRRLDVFGWLQRI